MRIYISGPMTGKPDLNRSAFEAAEKRLTAQGHFVINPHRISELFGTAEELKDSFEIMYYGKDCTREHIPIATRRHLAPSVVDAELAAVRTCDEIYLLHGWESSRGAKKELAEAIAHGLWVIQEGGAK